MPDRLVSVEREARKRARRRFSTSTGTVSGRGGEGETEGRRDGETERGGETRSLLAISSSSHSMGIDCAPLPVPPSLRPSVSPSLWLSVSLSFLSVNVEFL